MTESSPSKAFVNVTQLAKWPAFLPQFSDAEALQHVWVQMLETDASPDRVHASTNVFVDREIVLSIPGLDAVALTIAAGAGGTVVALDVDVFPELSVRVKDVPLALRLKADLFRPVRPVGTPEPGQPRQFELDPDKPFLDITLARVTVEVNTDGGLSLAVQGGIDLPPCMLGSSNIVIEAKDIGLYLDPDSPPPGKPVGWRGIHLASAALYLPGELAGIVGNLTLTDAYIGNGGFSGTVTDTWTPQLAASLFGMEFALKQVSLTFVQNALTTGSITGSAVLPFFDESLDIEICPNMNGPFLVRLSSANGIVTLTKPNILTIDVESLGFKVDAGVLSVLLSGRIKPLVRGLDWPSFKVRQLTIDSKGHVRLDGGWLDLPDQYALDFHGFKFEVTKLGFGNSDDGGKWIGFSGGLKLVDGLSAGASVEGLRVTWYSDQRPVAVTLNGVRVELAIPATLSLKGAISYREFAVGGETVHRFDGRIRLELIALDLSVDGTLVVGTASGPDGRYAFMAIYLDVELPAGIPLGPTGIGLYGIAGLFALQMEPDKHPDEEWYGMGPGEGWYHRGTVGVTDLAAKWVNRRGSIALGAGVTLGTVADNGFSFSGKVLLVLVFPGPILLLDGKANILRERSKLDEEPIFRALAVLDGRAGSLLFGLDAQYKYGEGGELIDIHGSVEAFFSFVDASAWHLYLGMRDPTEKRIRAEIIKLFEANSYFMLDAHQVAMGAWVGYDAHWDFGPLHVGVEAWIEGNAVLSWKPVHLSGDLWLHGKAELSVFGFGLSLSVDARFAAEVFDPFHVVASFSVGIGLPWPLPDFDVTITLEWGPEPVDPPLPMPLKEIAIEHFKVVESWPLPRGSLLLPDYDPDRDGFRSDPVPDATTQALQGPPATAPVVPLDCRPHITFSRSVHDAALVGVNPRPVVPDYERIGDPAKNQGPVKVKYSLIEVAMDSWTGSGWMPVARKAATPNPAGVDTLFGSWAAVPAMPDGNGENTAQVKLWLWSKSAFDYTRHTGRAWEDWFSDRFDDYPCPVPLRDVTVCCDFEDIGPGTPIVPPWPCPSLPEMCLVWSDPRGNHVTLLPTDVNGFTHALCFDRLKPNSDEGPTLFIELSVPAKSLRILLAEERSSVQAVAIDATGRQSGPFRPQSHVIQVGGPDIIRVALHGRVKFCLLEICVTFEPSREDLQARQDMVQHQQDELARWSQKGAVLQPYTDYRLKVATRIETTDNPIGDFDHVEFSYFRTEGPPGLVEPSAPVGAATDFKSALRDLARYVRQTVPPTVPGADERPPLPRPVYRRYDVGVAFNEDYVDLMYRLSRRDLGLYLYDNNSRPVRDVTGRLIVATNRWGVAETLSLSESDTRWISTIDASTCVTLDTTQIPRTVTLTAGDIRHVLAADTLYEARLVPLLLHDTFATPLLGGFAQGPAGTLDGWAILDEAANEGPSHWEIREAGVPPARFIVQTTNIWGGTGDGGDPVKPGSLLLRADNPALPAGHSEQPGNWTDVRCTVTLRSQDDGAIGVVFRFIDRNWHYRFIMDRRRRYRRLLRVAGGTTTVLAHDDFIFTKDRDYVVIIEAIGDALAVYLDGGSIFAIRDGTMTHGRIGFLCWANQGARFSDVRVDDYRADAPVPFRFKFITSRFVNFVHQLHSYADETWRVVLPGGTDIAPEVAAARPSGSALEEPEYRAFEALVAKLNAAAAPSEGAVRVSRIESGAAALALLVETDEPIDWSRTDLSVLYCPRAADRPDPPGAIKLVDAQFSEMATPNEEAVTLLLRDDADLSDWTVEHRRVPGPLTMPREGALIGRDAFQAEDRGLLYEETFGTNTLDGYAIFDEGTEQGPSRWIVQAGRIWQTSNVYGGSTAAADPAKPGTYALVGRPDWRDVRIRLRLRADDDDGIGLAFRWKDENNYYRFSMDAERGFRRLVKKVGGAVSVLWEEAAGYIQARTYALEVVAAGDQMLGYLDDALLFSLRDGDLQQGRVGLYCWANQGASFESFTVEDAATPPVLWEPGLTSLDGFAVLVENGAEALPVQWAAAGGLLRETSGVFVPDASAARPGTFVVGGETSWDDVALSATIEVSGPGALGVMLRYRDRDTYYRLSFDAMAPYRRLVRKRAGVVTVLWEDVTAVALAQPHRLTIRAVGSRLSASLDGQELFSVVDAGLIAGRMALYAAGCPTAQFSRVVVADATRRLGAWAIHDDGPAGGPSVWQAGGGALRQQSPIGGGGAVEAPGTYAVSPYKVSDCRLQVRLRSDTDGAIGIAVRYTDPQNTYRLSLSNMPGSRRLVKIVAGVATVLWQDGGGIPQGVALDWTLDIVGPVITGMLGTTPVFRVVDTSLPVGSVALYAAGNPAARFEAIEVRVPPLHAYALFEDRFRAGDLSAWTVLDEGSAARPSAWRVADDVLFQTSDIYAPPIDRDTLDKPGTLLLTGDPAWRDYVVTVRLRSDDDDALGVVFRYKDANHFYRFSWDHQRAYRRLVRNVGSAYTLLWQDDAVYEIGREYELTIVLDASSIRGYLDGVPLFVVDDFAVPAGRIGLYSWGNNNGRFRAVAVYPAALLAHRHLLDDPLMVEVARRWTAFDDGDVGGPSQWSVVDGWMTQTSAIRDGGDVNDPARPGTYTVTGALDWTDYQASVQMSSATDGGIGLMVRYRDSSNYYRFAIYPALGVRRLVRKVEGVVSVLWEDTIAGAPLVDPNAGPGGRILLTIACVGTRLTGAINGLPLFALDDNAHSAGRIALYCWANAGARFNEVRVTPADWSTYYQFGAEERRSAGHRLRLFSGSAMDAPPEAPLEERRFRAGGDDRGRAQWSADTATLRLVSPKGVTGHRETVLDQRLYVPLKFSLLRKADGTGFVLIAPAETPPGSQFDPGQVRLRFTYRRDNRARQPDSQVLSEAGTSGDEIATLEIPWVVHG